MLLKTFTEIRMSHEHGNEISKSHTEFLIDGVYAIVMR